MSLVSFLSCMYLVFTVILLLNKQKIGNVYMLFGLITFMFVVGYGFIPSIPNEIQTIGIFLVFSMMILLFGLMFGIMLKLFKRNNKISILASVLSSALLIIVLFNINGYLSYMYIPVLLYTLQNRIGIYIDNKRYEIN